MCWNELVKTAKLIPPAIIRPAMVAFTSSDDLNGTRLSVKRAKPALQNADTAWKTE